MSRDKALVDYAKENRPAWLAWLTSEGLSEVGRDPARHDRSTLTRFKGDMGEDGGDDWHEGDENNDGDDDDAATYVKQNRRDWVQWLALEGLSEMGNDPERHEPATWRRFQQENSGGDVGHGDEAERVVAVLVLP